MKLKLLIDAIPWLSLVFICLVFATLAGCATPRKECNIELIHQRHPELSEANEKYPALMMDFMHTITILEEKVGGYR